jgi:SAM-dependent methyltransferase
VFRDPMPDPDTVRSYYDAGYYSHWSHLKDFSAVYQMKRASAGDLVQRVQRLKPGGRWLDVGCAFGYLLDAAKAQGFETTGIELAADALRYHAEKGEHRVVPDATALGSLQFDVISLIDVIEHFADPHALLASLSGLLSEGGLLVVMTPDPSSLAACLLRSKWPHLQREHLVYFSRPSLRLILRSHGLHPVEVTFGKKRLSLAYVAGHFAKYVKGPLSNAFGKGVECLPRRLRDMPLSLPTGQLVLAVKA